MNDAHIEAQTPAQIDSATYTAAAGTLRAGMYVSFTVMLVGLAWWLLSGAKGGTTAAATRGIALDKLLPELTALNPLAFLDLGVLLLLITPVATLIAQIITFSLAGNRRFAGVTLFIGLVLLLSIALSFGWLKLF